MIEILVFFLFCLPILFPIFMVFWFALMLVGLVDTPEEIKEILKSRQKPANKKVLRLLWLSYGVVFVGLLELVYTTVRLIANNSIIPGIIYVIFSIVAGIEVFYLTRILKTKRQHESR